MRLHRANGQNLVTGYSLAADLGVGSWALKSTNVRPERSARKAGVLAPQECDAARQSSLRPRSKKAVARWLQGHGRYDMHWFAALTYAKMISSNNCELVS